MINTSTCQACGAERSASARYCFECGRELEKPLDPAIAPVDSGSSSASSLLSLLPFVEPGHSGRNFFLGFVYFIGLPVFLILLISTLVELPERLKLLMGFVGISLLLFSCFLLLLSFTIPVLLLLNGTARRKWDSLRSGSDSTQRSKGVKAMSAFGFLLAFFLVTALVGLGGVVAMDPPSDPEVTQTSLSNQETVTGDPVVVAGNVTNTENESQSTTVALTANGEVVDTREIDLEPEETREVTFDYAFDEPGEYALQLNGKPVGNVVVERNVQISETTTSDREIEAGESSRITGVATNVGTTSGSITVDLLVNGEVVETERYDVAPGERQEIEFDREFDSAGRYDIEVNEIFVDTINVAAKRPAAFRVTQTSVSDSTLEMGDSTEVTANVENTGERRGSTSVSLYVDDERVETKDVNLSPGEKRTVSFQRSFDESGSHSVRVNDAIAGDITVEVPEHRRCPETSPDIREIYSIEEISYSDVVRYEVTIRLHEEGAAYTDEDFRKLGRAVVCNSLEEEDVNAIAILYYEPDQYPSYDRAYARGVWAPYSDWSRAGDVTTGDYTHHGHEFERLG